MTNYLKVSITLLLASTLLGCTANSNNYALGADDAATIRSGTEQLEQKDRDTRHVERMRRADAYSHATRNLKTTIIVPR